MNKNVVILIVVILIVLLIGGGVFMMRRGDSAEQVTITPTPFVETPTEMPTEEPVEEVDKSTLNVKVLNGTAVAGLAAKIETALKEAGFTVSSIGNADKKDYQQVVIQAKTSVPTSIIDELKTALGTTYTYGVQEELDDTEEDDIIIIMGTKSAISPTSTQKTTPAVTSGATPTMGSGSPTPTPTP